MSQDLSPTGDIRVTVIPAGGSRSRALLHLTERPTVTQLSMCTTLWREWENRRRSMWKVCEQLCGVAIKFPRYNGADQAFCEIFWLWINMFRVPVEGL